MSNFQPVKLHVRAGYQGRFGGNRHKCYGLAVPWQIAEAIPEGQWFVPWLDTTAGRIVFDSFSEPDQYLTYGAVMATLAACGVEREQSSRISAVLRGMGEADA